jgi:hypothetical protein
MYDKGEEKERGKTECVCFKGKTRKRKGKTMFKNCWIMSRPVINNIINL